MDYGPLAIYYGATIQDTFPGGKDPSVASIASLLASVGQVDHAPRKRPKSSCMPFVRTTAMALWQLGGFEFRLANGHTTTFYQILDDATRYDVGTWAYPREGNSADAQHVFATPIDVHGAPF